MSSAGLTSLRGGRDHLAFVDMLSGPKPAQKGDESSLSSGSEAARAAEATLTGLEVVDDCVLGLVVKGGQLIFKQGLVVLFVLLPDKNKAGLIQTDHQTPVKWRKMTDFIRLFLGVPGPLPGLVAFLLLSMLQLESKNSAKNGE